MELSEVTGDVNLDDIDSEVLPRLVMNSNEPNNNDDDNKDQSRIEANRKQFQCDVCNKNFSTKGNLKVHKRKHTNQCDVCYKNFSTKDILKIHLRNHTGGKLYACEYCEKTFTKFFRLFLLIFCLSFLFIDLMENMF